MRSKKLTNQERGNAGEELTQLMFNLQGTGGSGVGAYDKLDSKNRWIKAETKCTSKGYYQLSIEKFEKWRFQAAQDRRQFFLHLIPEVSGETSWEYSLVVISKGYFKSLAPEDLDETHYLKYFEVNKSFKVEFGKLCPQKFWAVGEDIPETWTEGYWELATPSGNLVVLRAPYFKELLEKE